MKPIEKGQTVWVCWYECLTAKYNPPFKEMYDPMNIKMLAEYFPDEKDAWTFYRDDLYDRQKEINRLVVEATKKLKTLEN